MERFKNISSSYKAVIFTLALTVFNSLNTFAGNVIDSDMSNTAGTNLGNSHLDIYIFIIALLILCLIIPYWEDKQKAKKSS